MYNPDINIIKDIDKEEIDYLRTLLPTFRMGKEKVLRDGEYKIGYDPKSKEAMLFKLGKPVIKPTEFESLIYKLFDEKIESIRQGTGNSEQYLRFELN
jgi:hypothetical protein